MLVPYYTSKVSKWYWVLIWYRPNRFKLRIIVLYFSVLTCTNRFWAKVRKSISTLSQYEMHAILYWLYHIESVINQYVLGTSFMNLGTWWWDCLVLYLSMKCMLYCIKCITLNQQLTNMVLGTRFLNLGS